MNLLIIMAIAMEIHERQNALPQKYSNRIQTNRKLFARLPPRICETGKLEAMIGDRRPKTVSTPDGVK